MRMKNYPEDSGKMVWLGLEEVENLISAAGDTRRTIAISLGARCGLRSQEVVDVTPADIVDTEAGSTRTFERWVHHAGDRLRAETGDEGWQFVTPHDLRRSWGTLLVEDDVEPGIIMEWGGWEDWETFREHYLGAYSMKKQRMEQEKVSWL